MSESGLQDAGVWRCPCGRQVPARFDECHCGIRRVDALAAAKAAEPPPRKPLSLLGLSLRLGAAAAVIVVVVALALAFFPVAPPLPMPSMTPTPPPRATARPAPSPAAVPASAWPDDPALWVAPEPPPPAVPHEAPPETTPPEPTEADLLQAKTEQWRSRYRPVAERVERLQQEVAKLESGTLPYSSDPDRNAEIARLNALVRERLEAARRDLEQAKQELSQLEEAAAADGIPPGQLR